MPFFPFQILSTQKTEGFRGKAKTSVMTWMRKLNQMNNQKNAEFVQNVLSYDYFILRFNFL